jgi:hypothetical protein
MIKLLGKGTYTLLETKHHVKILKLNKHSYAWIAPPIGEVLVVTDRPHITDCLLSIGEYRLYDVDDEPDLTDLPHLELEVGGRVWQGYLLPTGLPAGAKLRSRIIPTHEHITEIPIRQLSPPRERADLPIS